MRALASSGSSELQVPFSAHIVFNVPTRLDHVTNNPSAYASPVQRLNLRTWPPFQDGDDVTLRFPGALRRDQERLDSVVGPAGNHYLHEVGRLGVERSMTRAFLASMRTPKAAPLSREAAPL